MFFTKWFEGINRDKKQLYYITGQILKFKTELVELEDSVRQIELLKSPCNCEELTVRVKLLEEFIQNNLKH